MCGRYTHALTWSEIVALYRITESANQMWAWPVSTRVNSVKNDEPDRFAPAPA